ncbi:tetrathionate reductase subunit C [Proteus mirabilis]|uniref:Tetrathionate reductase subunit C n=1 Tax=Proteus mirabilis TaxID=584 RepID=A0A379GG79_PROMI|nr:tetrathionate reductase subunit C [Proteus mirabilis]
MISSVSQIQEVIAIPKNTFGYLGQCNISFLSALRVAQHFMHAGNVGKGRTGNPRLEAVAVFIAVTAGITAPLALTADLHQTARVWHFMLIQLLGRGWHGDHYYCHSSLHLVFCTLLPWSCV